MNGDRLWKTTDLGTAAYVHMHLNVHGVTQDGGRFTFVFEDPEGRGQKLQVEYMNSECRKYDSAVRSLKKLCHDIGQNRRTRNAGGMRRG